MRHIPRKRFGQHFLTDESVIAALVAAIEPRPRDLMVEIGPGLGALTRPLAARLDHLHVIKSTATSSPAFKPVPGCPCHGARRRRAQSVSGRWRPVARDRYLPYNISTPLLFHLAQYAGVIRDITHAAEGNME